MRLPMPRDLNEDEGWEVLEFEEDAAVGGAG